jgi:hypothetical protein
LLREIGADGRRTVKWAAARISVEELSQAVVHGEHVLRVAKVPVAYKHPRRYGEDDKVWVPFEGVEVEKQL